MTDIDLPYHIETGDGYCAMTLNAAGNDPRWSDIEAIGTQLVSHVEQSGQNAVVVDLTPLNYIGSAMVAVIVRVWKAVKQRDGRMVVVNRDPNVYEVLRISGLHNVWTVVESLEDGLAELGVAREQRVARGDSQRLAFLAPIAALAAAGGLFLMITSPTYVSSLAAVCLTFGWAALGLLAAALTLPRCSGAGKLLAALALVACVAILVAGGVYWPDDLRKSSTDPRAGGVSANGPSETGPSEPASLAEAGPDRTVPPGDSPTQPDGVEAPLSD